MCRRWKSSREGRKHTLPTLINSLRPLASPSLHLSLAFAPLHSPSLTSRLHSPSQTSTSAFNTRICSSRGKVAKMSGGGGASKKTVAVGEGAAVR
jgi:hypothetical protein